MGCGDATNLKSRTIENSDAPFYAASSRRVGSQESGGIAPHPTDDEPVRRMGHPNLLIASARTAADEVDYFQAVAFFQLGLGPAVAGDDFAVEFYGYAVGFHVQGFDQGCQREAGFGIC